MQLAYHQYILYNIENVFLFIKGKMIRKNMFDDSRRKNINIPVNY